ncbi:cytochrome P450 [Nocardia yunnanensis]|uniref:Cytochrome P450 n=2 Tax=Nocardia yunnanensis TaxID=2382165 RepID=A0A386ZK46_9NOCA|nr:cytochrome P450 [Nocardia yunnanensis]
MAPGPWPVLGHLVPITRDPLGFMESLPAHGDLVRISLGPITAVVICDPELTHRMFRRDRIFDKGGPHFDSARELVGQGVATCPHALHRRQRRLLQPAFHASRVSAYGPTVTRKISAMVDSWHDGQILDINVELQALAFRVIVATLFDEAISEAHQQRLIHHVQVVFSGVFRQAVMPRRLRHVPILGNRSLERAAAETRAILGELVATRRTVGGDDQDDMFSALISARDTDGGCLSETEIVEQAFTFIFAGTDSSAATLAWALILLDEHPDVAARVYTEVDTVLAGRPASHEDLPRLRFTEQVITETLRLHPPSWLTPRTVTEDTELGGHRLSAGTTIIYSSHLIHHRADLHPDPDRFDPDRFAPAKIPPPRKALMPFADGARKCIAEQYAVSEAVMTLATIAARWHLAAVTGTNTKPSRAVVPHPRRLRMRATARVLENLPPHVPAERA